ncbi:MAG: hypothetical protein NVSMB4_20020 [Acidimicrobiales bacterium]
MAVRARGPHWSCVPLDLRRYPRRITRETPAGRLWRTTLPHDLPHDAQTPPAMTEAMTGGGVVVQGWD